MENQNETLAQSPVAGPSCESCRLDSSSQQKENRGRPSIWHNRPEQQCGCAQCDRDDIQPAESNWEPAGIVSDQPIAGEARNDAPANQHDEHHYGRDANPDAVVSRAAKMCLDVKAEIAEPECR